MKSRAVTLLESIVVMLIIGVISGGALLSFNLVETRRFKSEVNMLLADIWWAREMAITRRQDHYITFNTTYDRYAITLSASTYTSDCLPGNLAATCVKPTQVFSDGINLTVAPVRIRFYDMSNASDNELPLGALDCFGADHIDFENDRGTKTDNLYIAEDSGYVQRRAPATPPDYGWCFIATAGYGPDSQEVKVLRSFRDQYLLTNKPGKAMVELYYNFSPPLARYIEQRQWAKALTRGLLRPVVRLCQAALGDDDAQ